MSFSDQIDHLETNKNLVIPDRAFAEIMLRRIGYFGLIGGYKAPFKNPTTKKYRDGTSFGEIVALYRFDEGLRELFLKYILQIERHIRSLLSYYFTEKYGEQQIHYLTAANYSSNPKDIGGVKRLIAMLEELAVRNTDYPYINHQRLTHGNVPLWVLVNRLTLGSLSKFYGFLTSDLQAKVAKNFDRVNIRQLEQFLHVMTKFRNVCAHNERLFSYQTRNDIPDLPLHQKLGIPKRGTQYIWGKHDLFALVLVFRYLLPREAFRTFKASLAKMITRYLGTSNALPEAVLYQYMGFPSNWKKVSVYEK